MILRGLIAPNLTPFNRDSSIDRVRYVAHAKRCLGEGCVGLAPFGTTGEALSIGMDERMESLEALVTGGVDPGRLLPGTGLTNLPDTIRLTRHAAELGCAGALVLPPFFYKAIGEEGLFAYFARLVEATGGARIFLYHIPAVAGVGFPVGVVRRLREAFPEAILGIKDSSGDWANTRALLEIGGLAVYPGSELLLLEALGHGAQGCISATANRNGSAIARIIELARAGDAAAARAAMEPVAAYRRLIQEAGNIGGLKRLLALESGEESWAIVRPPLVPLGAAEGMKLAAEIGKIAAVATRAA